MYPGYPGLVIAEGAIRPMVWGFPLHRKGKSGQPLKPKPINNARCDKLTGGFWRSSFAARRCLIPVESFAEAEGTKGAKTRVWFSRPHVGTMAVAGIWRSSSEWGDCYSMVMTEACEAVSGVHDRMPVILNEEDHRAWISGTLEDALALCHPFEGELAIERSGEPWSGAPRAQPKLL